jgi:hypothetical protein
VTPIDVYNLRLYAAELNTTTSINVFLPFQLKAAITATNVKANQTTATVDITFGISNPYDIKYISNDYPGDGGVTIPGVPWVSNNVPDIAAAYVLDVNGTVVPTATVTQSSNAGLRPCLANDFDSVCSRLLRAHVFEWHMQVSLILLFFCSPAQFCSPALSPVVYCATLHTTYGTTYFLCTYRTASAGARSASLLSRTLPARSTTRSPSTPLPLAATASTRATTARSRRLTLARRRRSLSAPPTTVMVSAPS